jgi:hypothetical protein
MVKYIERKRSAQKPFKLTHFKVFCPLLLFIVQCITLKLVGIEKGISEAASITLLVCFDNFYKVKLKLLDTIKT